MISLSDFSGGLNLTDASGVIDPRFAIDLLNVEFSSRGGILQRPGYGEFSSAAAASRYDSLFPFYKSDGTKRLLAGRDGAVDALASDGDVEVSQTGLSAEPHYFARFAAPGSELVYIGNGTDKIFKFDGSAFTAPGSMGTVPKGKFVAVQSPDNRLVNAGFSTTTGGPSGASTNPSTVWFSEEGDPETWDANNYVHLDPGDGEEIMGIGKWGTYLIVFKETKFFVFTGNGEAADGSPEFNFRPELGVGCVAPKAIVNGRDGVYFLSRSGIYRTTGGPAELVTANIDPLFTLASLPSFYSGVAINMGAIDVAAAGYWNERLYFAVPTGSSSTNNRLLVFDPRFGWWSVYDIPAAALASWRPGQNEELMFAYASGTNDIGRHARTFNDDIGSAIASHCRTGFFEAAGGGETHLRQVRVYGSGYVTVKASVDYAAGQGFGIVADLDSNTDTWGDGTDPNDVWADGTDDTDKWGPTIAFSSEVLSGFGQVGRFYSITFANETLNRTLYVERLNMDFRGSRRRNI